MICSAVALAVAAVVLPESESSAGGRIDWAGAIVLTAWLVAFLLGITQSTSWGWLDGRTLGLFGGAAVLLGLWVAVESKVQDALVPMALVRLRAMRTTNAAT